MSAPHAGDTGELRAEQRRMALAALAAAAWLLAVAAIGMVEALGYLAPTLALFVLLALGRYPGERAFARRIANRAHRRRPRRTPAVPQTRSLPVALPRGGRLLATGLAGRAPPFLVG